jgi:tRNA nucleotidyltransferase (CCA-adding enzyme)
VTNRHLANSKLAANTVAQSVKNWAGDWLANIGLSGSYAKGTAVLGESDVDLFISLKSDTPFNLEEIYDSLFQWAKMKVGLLIVKQFQSE